MKGKNRLLIILLCASLFAFLGWMSPLLFHSYAPQSYYMEMHSSKVGNVSVGDKSHYMCFDRTFNQRSSGTLFIEMYLVDDNGNKVEVLSESDQRYFQEGRQMVREEVNLPDNLEPGEYRYERIYRINVAKGQVERTFVFRSERFYIKDGPAETYEC